MISTKWSVSGELSDVERNFIRDEEGVIYLFVFDDNILSGYGSVRIKNEKTYINKIYTVSEERENIISDLILRMIIRKNYDNGKNDIYVSAKETEREYYIRFGFKASTEISDDLMYEGDVGGKCC